MFGEQDIASGLSADIFGNVGIAGIKNRPESSPDICWDSSFEVFEGEV